VLKALREAGNALLSELYSLDEERLCRRPEEGEWCLKEIAAHMRDAEELALRQMQSIAEGAPRLPAWDTDLLPMERDYLSGDAEEILIQFGGLRRQTTELLWSLDEEQWHESGHHPYRGEVTIGQVAHELAQHDLEHLWHVRQLKYQLGAVRVRRDDEWR